MNTQKTSKPRWAGRPLAWSLAALLLLALPALPRLSLAGVPRQGEMRRPRSEGVSAVITVNTLADENDGSCSDGDCSLRDAIQVAGGGDTITFSMSGTIALTLGQLVMNKNLAISGPGASHLTLSGNNASRVLFIQEGANVTLSDLTIADGQASGGDDKGGGIYNLGHLTLRRCIIADNQADWDGGGIYNYSTGILDAQQSTFIGNSALWGGGIKNENATISLANCTFYNNSANIRGGGIDSGADSTLNITNCTFSGNIKGGIGNPWSETTAVNTIVANNSEYDCSGGFTSSSTHNLSTDDTCSPGFSIVTPEALKLAWQEWLFALPAGSVAIDAGANGACPAVDQRGTARPLDGNNDGTAVCDVGSYEYCQPVEETGIVGPGALLVGQTGFYTATYAPPTATIPITFTWDNGTSGPTATYSWTLPGLYTLTLTASNPCGQVSATHRVEVCQPVEEAGIVGPEALLVGQTGFYTATYAPPTATTPITFTWDNGTSGPTAAYSWTAEGVYTITVTGTNACGEAVGHLSVQVLAEQPYRLYLPLIVR